MATQNNPRDPRTAIRQPRVAEEYLTIRAGRYLTNPLHKIIDADVDRYMRDAGLRDDPAPGLPTTLYVNGPMHVHPLNTENCSSGSKNLVDILGNAGDKDPGREKAERLMSYWAGVEGYGVA